MGTIFGNADTDHFFSHKDLLDRAAVGAGDSVRLSEETMEPSLQSPIIHILHEYEITCVIRNLYFKFVSAAKPSLS